MRGVCCGCQCPGAEIRVIPCSCEFHVKCFPLANATKQVVSKQDLKCPACDSDAMTGIYLLPIDVKSVQNALNVPTASVDPEANKKYQDILREEFFLSLASTFLAESSSITDIAIAEDLEVRNGRWTSEEVEFIECLIKCFKDGVLPISNGTTLNNFLRSIFLCKSTRLRKKIKNANFCTSTYSLNPAAQDVNVSSELSRLQIKFLETLENERSKKLLKFNMTRMWGTYFFNLCVQQGFEYIIAQDWLDSLEYVESKVTAAKEARRTRERRNRVRDISGSVMRQNGKKYGYNMDRPKQSLDCSNHSYGRGTYGFSLDRSNHSHGMLSLDGSNTGKKRSSLDISQRTMPSLEGPPIRNCFPRGSHAPNSNGNIVPTWNTLSSSHKSYFSPKENRFGPALPPVSSDKHRYEPPKHPYPHQRQSLPGSLLNQGLPRKPQLVPIEIREVQDVDDLGSVSDVSDSQHDRLGSSKERASSPSNVSSISDVDELSHNPKRIRVRDDTKKNSSSNSEDLLTDLSDLCDQFGDWGPFVQKVSDFVESEDLPFQYFDVWVVSKADGQSDQDDGDTTMSASSDVVLRHAGHSARSDTESIWTLYHMNEFGRFSANFKFPPGIGLPGRVLSSGQPTWDDSIQNLSSSKFPRVQGAITHGIVTGLGFPMFNTPVGRVVVAMYSSTPVEKSQSLVQKCCAQFQFGHVVNPKWALVMDVGEKNKKQIKSSSTSTPNIAIDHEEQHIVDLLAKYSPFKMNDFSSHSPQAVGHTSLRLVLLQPPSKRSVTQNDAVCILKKSYRNYVQAKRKESEVASLLVHEWMFMSAPATDVSQYSAGPVAPTSSSVTSHFLPLSRPLCPSVSVYHTNYASTSQAPQSPRIDDSPL